jgi:hypothetical protein
MAKSKGTTHEFTSRILEVLEEHFGTDAKNIFEKSPLLGYLNQKTKAASRGSKARGSFANIYALYVLVEDYIAKGYGVGLVKESYSKYEGAQFSTLFKRQRELPFGAKLQNHALNSRLNDEFKKFYPLLDKQPIVRDVTAQRYWIQEDLLLVNARGFDGKEHEFNIAHAVIGIVDAYSEARAEALAGFLATCSEMSKIGKKEPEKAVEFIQQQLQPNVDARIFEIVSYSVMRARYGRDSVWFGETQDSVVKEQLVLYKTGRTNANDGGIDFVMKPLGRFFQVTETTDVTKYFLDIDKVQRFPITFVVKSEESPKEILNSIRKQAIEKFKIDSVVNSYMDAVEEVIAVDELMKAFKEVVKEGGLDEVMDEVVTQSKVEFNYQEGGSVVDESDD